MKISSIFILPVVFSLSCLTLNTSIAQDQDTKPTKVRPGVVILVEGIGGFNLMQLSGKIGFHNAGLPHKVEQFYWSHGFGRFMCDLQDERHVLEKGMDLAKEIWKRKKENPKEPIYLIGHSGGTGVAVRAAELLPKNTIQRMILLSSALSPEYNLVPALSACKNGIVSYYSPHDHFFLRFGTSQFGTIDRMYCTSAGCQGFEVPKELFACEKQAYSNLRQIPWNSKMILHGNFGNHTGTVQPSFLEHEVSRWLRD